ncbi:uncharacterized protein LOC134851239 [Symsagittifera roscoffensis]|uniref:uncharacterized protein LOC134851239 n=1 Tax=Symsagittifera roscoffensis TaxID=84072 RepID=UPI00307BC17B
MFLASSACHFFFAGRNLVYFDSNFRFIMFYDPTQPTNSPEASPVRDKTVHMSRDSKYNTGQPPQMINFKIKTSRVSANRLVTVDGGSPPRAENNDLNNKSGLSEISPVAPFSDNGVIVRPLNMPGTGKGDILSISLASEIDQTENFDVDNETKLHENDDRRSKQSTRSRSRSNKRRTKSKHKRETSNRSRSVSRKRDRSTPRDSSRRSRKHSRSKDRHKSRKNRSNKRRSRSSSRAKRKSISPVRDEERLLKSSKKERKRENDDRKSRSRSKNEDSKQSKQKRRKKSPSSARVNKEVLNPVSFEEGLEDETTKVSRKSEKEAKLDQKVEKRVISKTDYNVEKVKKRDKTFEQELTCERVASRVEKYRKEVLGDESLNESKDSQDDQKVVPETERIDRSEKKRKSKSHKEKRQSSQENETRSKRKEKSDKEENEDANDEYLSKKRRDDIKESEKDSIQKTEKLKENENTENEVAKTPDEKNEYNKTEIDNDRKAENKNNEEDIDFDNTFLSKSDPQLQESFELRKDVAKNEKVSEIENVSKSNVQFIPKQVKKKPLKENKEGQVQANAEAKTSPTPVEKSEVAESSETLDEKTEDTEKIEDLQADKQIIDDKDCSENGRADQEIKGKKKYDSQSAEKVKKEDKSIKKPKTESKRSSKRRSRSSSRKRSRHERSPKRKQQRSKSRETKKRDRLSRSRSRRRKLSRSRSNSRNVTMRSKRRSRSLNHRSRSTSRRRSKVVVERPRRSRNSSRKREVSNLSSGSNRSGKKSMPKVSQESSNPKSNDYRNPINVLMLENISSKGTLDTTGGDLQLDKSAGPHSITGDEKDKELSKEHHEDPQWTAVSDFFSENLPKTPKTVGNITRDDKLDGDSKKLLAPNFDFGLGNLPTVINDDFTGLKVKKIVDEKVQCWSDLKKSSIDQWLDKSTSSASVMTAKSAQVPMMTPPMPGQIPPPLSGLPMPPNFQDFLKQQMLPRGGSSSGLPFPLPPFIPSFIPPPTFLPPPMPIAGSSGATHTGFTAPPVTSMASMGFPGMSASSLTGSTLHMTSTPNAKSSFSPSAVLNQSQQSTDAKSSEPKTPLKDEQNSHNSSQAFGFEQLVQKILPAENTPVLAAKSLSVTTEMSKTQHKHQQQPETLIPTPPSSKPPDKEKSPPPMPSPSYTPSLSPIANEQQEAEELEAENMSEINNEKQEAKLKSVTNMQGTLQNLQELLSNIKGDSHLKNLNDSSKIDQSHEDAMLPIGVSVNEFTPPRLDDDDDVTPSTTDKLRDLEKLFPPPPGSSGSTTVSPMKKATKPQPMPVLNKADQKQQMQERVAALAKKYLKPFYTKNKVDKDQYKHIMRRVVNKCTEGVRNKEVKAEKVKKLVASYVSHMEVKGKH